MNAIPLRPQPDTIAFTPVISLVTGQTYLDSEGRLTCPCGHQEFEVADSEPWVNGSKRRYRRCVKCKLRVRTKEVVDE